MSDPMLFTEINNRIPSWVQVSYRRLALIADASGHLVGGYAQLAIQLGFSKTHAIKLMRWLIRLKLVVVIQTGGQGRGRATTWQLRRWFWRVPKHEKVTTPYKVYKKNLKTNTYGDSPRWKRYATMNLRRAVTRVKTLSKEQHLTLTRYVGRLIWKLGIQPHQVKALWEWLNDILPHYPLKLTGRGLIRWFIGKIGRLAAPQTARWAQEVAEAKLALKAELIAPNQVAPLNETEQAQQRAKVRAALVADGWVAQ